MRRSMQRELQRQRASAYTPDRALQTEAALNRLLDDISVFNPGTYGILPEQPAKLAAIRTLEHRGLVTACTVEAGIIIVELTAAGYQAIGREPLPRIEIQTEGESEMVKWTREEQLEMIHRAQRRAERRASGQSLREIEAAEQGQATSSSKPPLIESGPGATRSDSPSGDTPRRGGRPKKLAAAHPNGNGAVTAPKKRGPKPGTGSRPRKNPIPVDPDDLNQPAPPPVDDHSALGGSDYSSLDEQVEIRSEDNLINVLNEVSTDYREQVAQTAARAPKPRKWGEVQMVPLWAAPAQSGTWLELSQQILQALDQSSPDYVAKVEFEDYDTLQQAAEAVLNYLTSWKGVESVWVWTRGLEMFAQRTDRWS
jgi:hypothetical protein